VADKNGEVNSNEATPTMHIIKDEDIEGVTNIIGKTVVVYDKAEINTDEEISRLCCGVIYLGEMPPAEVEEEDKNQDKEEVDKNEPEIIWPYKEP